MKIAYFGYDFFEAVLTQLLTDGHEVSHVFSFKVDEADTYNCNDRLLATAERIGASISLDRPSKFLPEQLAAAGCELALLVGYPYRVSCSDRIRILNLHPTLLPQGRGPYPIPWLILRNPGACGLTLHKVSSEMDAGDIVAQQSVPIDGLETLELVSARLQFAAPRFASETILDLDNLWASARPQAHKASYWKASEEEWTLDWTGDVDSVLRTVRAFGRLETVAIIEGQSWSVADAEGWVQPHAFRGGELVHHTGPDLLVAVSNGFVLLKQPRLDVVSSGDGP